MSFFRTDQHNNPTAFIVQIAHDAGLKEGTDYQQGNPFEAGGRTYYTARLLGDPIALTIRVIDALSFVTPGGESRWVYITMPKFTWDELTAPQKRDIIGWMYQREGGTEMRHLFPRYGQL